MDFLSQNLESQITDQIKALSGDILRNEAKNLDLSQNPFIIDIIPSFEDDIIIFNFLLYNIPLI